jgi:hypothetical protein
MEFSQQLIAISRFRAQPHPIALENPAALFCSSGTTQATRSLSPFSEKGLSEYKGSVLDSFNEFVGPLVKGHKLLTLISPDTPNSSLAMMMKFLIEELGFEYVPELRSEHLDMDRPVMVFATLVQWLDHPAIKLPKGSIIIETGGLKKKFAQIDKQAAFAKISYDFGPDIFISEYSMAELASQAYAIHDQSYRFSSWVTLRVLFEGKVHDQGKGLLVIEDQRRCDLQGAILTEDLVDLKSDQSFDYIERLESAPLKGCSLGFEKPTQGVYATTFSTDSTSFTNMGQRSDLLNEKLLSILKDPNFHHELASITGSVAESKALCHITSQSLPESQVDWIEAAKVATQNTPNRWLMIAANNHPLSILYPMSMAFVAGKELWLRSRFEKCLQPFSTFFSGFLPNHLGLKDYDHRLFDAILAFGANETLEDLRKQSNLPIRGFGSRVCASLFTGEADGDIQNLIHDFFLMAQRGCQSSRVLICRKTPSPSWLKSLEKTFATFWNSPLSLQQQCALDLERTRLEHLGCEIVSYSPLLIAQCPRWHEAFLPQASFCVMILDESAYLRGINNSHSQTPPLDEIYTPRNWGNAHKILWNGLLHGESLFGGALP